MTPHQQLVLRAFIADLESTGNRNDLATSGLLAAVLLAAGTGRADEMLTEVQGCLRDIMSQERGRIAAESHTAAE